MLNPAGPPRTLPKRNPEYELPETAEADRGCGGSFDFFTAELQNFGPALTKTAAGSSPAPAF